MLVAAGIAAGCGSDPFVTARSVEQSTKLEFVPQTATFHSPDLNTADIYLSDLPPSFFEPAGGALDPSVSGQIVHMHLFVAPKAGDTPIDSTACSIGMRYIVIAKGQVGLYGGGGFLLPGGTLNGAELSGSISKGTLRLLAQTPSFTDRLGAAEFSAYFEAKRNQAQVRAMASKIAMLVDGLPMPAPGKME